jgi:hypothetical protein
MNNLAAGDLKIDVVHSPERALLELHWLGKSIVRNPGKILDPYLTEVVKFAAGMGTKVEMHFERMQRFNSATVTSLILLLQEATRQQVPLVIYFDSKLPWQRVSFEALQKLASRSGNSTELRPV